MHARTVARRLVLPSSLLCDHSLDPIAMRSSGPERVAATPKSTAEFQNGENLANGRGTSQSGRISGDLETHEPLHTRRFHAIRPILLNIEDSFADDAVWSESFSASNSLLNREITGNFFDLASIRPTEARKSHEPLGGLRQILCATERGILKAEQGIFRMEQGNSSRQRHGVKSLPFRSGWSFEAAQGCTRLR